MIRKVFYEVDPLLCPQCGGQIRIISFLTDFSVLDRIINRLKLTFMAERPPPPRIAYQEVVMAAETGGEYFSYTMTHVLPSQEKTKSTAPPLYERPLGRERP